MGKIKFWGLYFNFKKMVIFGPIQQNYSLRVKPNVVFQYIVGFSIIKAKKNRISGNHWKYVMTGTISDFEV